MDNIEFFEKILEIKLNSLNKRDIVFLCIGTNKNIVDSVGPKIGSILEKEIGKNRVFGSMNKNICDLNIVAKNYKKIKNKKIISIDAAVSNNYKNGEIFFTNGPTIMGAATGNVKGIVGDYSIKLVLNNLYIKNTKYIDFIAKSVSSTIVKVIKKR